MGGGEQGKTKTGKENSNTTTQGKTKLGKPKLERKIYLQIGEETSPKGGRA